MLRENPYTDTHSENEAAAIRPISLKSFFGRKGPLAKKLKGYEAREEQVQVAIAIENAMTDGKPCLAEAGTGVGKTLSYLIPAIRAALNGKTTVISTHTINLQNQLMEKDIPLVLSLFPEEAQDINPVLMKGRGNFLCKQSLENARNDLFLTVDPFFFKVQRWAASAGCTGDVADLPFTFPHWYELTSTPETCRAQECSFYDTCYYYQMRSAASNSNLIVVNHALFFADLALRLTDPNSGVLPHYDHVVLDEAHHLEDVATRTFGIEFSSKRLLSLLDRVKHVSNLDMNNVSMDTIESLNSSLFHPFTLPGKSELYFDEALQDEKKDVTEKIARDTCASLSALQTDLIDKAKDDETQRDRLEGIARLCGKTREELDRLMFGEDENAIRWAEVSPPPRSGKQESRITLHLTPVSVAAPLETTLWNPSRSGGVILVSATLANSGGFSYLRSRLGIPDEAIECLVGSPFDYKQQAMLYVPAHLPPPASNIAVGNSPTTANSDRMDGMVDEIFRLVQLTRGRAFLLFTSKAALNTVYEKLFPKVDFPLFKQGDLPPAKLLKAFRESENGCLLGAQTFWEGVDIQGESLSCVIIDRLPFAVPDSPVTKARFKAIEDQGGNSFKDYSIPQAQIRLKQGFGRLIRTKTDRGIVCILDSRLLTKYYGAEFVKYLPPAARASKWQRVERFWLNELNPPTEG